MQIVGKTVGQVIAELKAIMDIPDDVVPLLTNGRMHLMPAPLDRLIEPNDCLELVRTKPTMSPAVVLEPSCKTCQKKYDPRQESLRYPKSKPMGVCPRCWDKYISTYLPSRYKFSGSYRGRAGNGTEPTMGLRIADDPDELVDRQGWWRSR